MPVILESISIWKAFSVALLVTVLCRAFCCEAVTWEMVELFELVFIKLCLNWLLDRSIFRLAAFTLGNMWEYIWIISCSYCHIILIRHIVTVWLIFMNRKIMILLKCCELFWYFVVILGYSVSIFCWTSIFIFKIISFT